MKTYTVSDVSKMLNVNEETVRRWIRDGRLVAKRAVGRGGNTILLEDVISFANKPPRAYLLSLETWLKSNGINYEKIEDVTDKETKKLAASIVGATSAATATIAGTATIAPLLAASAAALGATKMMKRKNYQQYSIRISGSDNNTPAENETSEQADAENAELLTIEAAFESCKADAEVPTSVETDVTQSDTSTATNVLDEISRAKQLLDAEIITQEEFAAIKARLIARL